MNSLNYLCAKSGMETLLLLRVLTMRLDLNGIRQIDHLKVGRSSLLLIVLVGLEVHLWLPLGARVCPLLLLLVLLVLLHGEEIEVYIYILLLLLINHHGTSLLVVLLRGWRLKA